MLSRSLIFAAGLVAALCCAVFAQAQIRTVAISDSAAPGVESGALIRQFPQSVFGPQISFDNVSGSAFLARMAIGVGGVTSDNDAGVWSERSGSTELVAREGAQAPGIAPDGVFEEFTRAPVLNDAGQVAFPARLRPGFGDVTLENDSGVWAQRDGQLQLVVREGSQAPGTPPSTSFSAFTANSFGDRYFAFNNLGRTAFTASLATAGGSVTASNDTGIWAETDSGLTLIAREGASAPGTSAGAVFEDLTGQATDESAVMNHRGQLAFTAQLRLGPGGVTTGNDFGIWIADDGEVTLAVRAGSNAPADIGGVFRRGFGAVQINDSGSLLFRGLLNPSADVTLANDDALWLRRNETIELVAREGSQIPGAPEGARFGDFGSSAVLNNHNRVAVNSYLQMGTGGVTQDNNAALLSGPAEDVRIITRENDLAPGTLGGVFEDFFLPNINTAGQVAFMAWLKPNVGGVSAINDRGIWATDVHGVLHQIIREGDLLEVAPGDVRTITQLGFRGQASNADGRYSMFNDFGQLQFWAQFEGGGEGIFVSDLVKRDPSPADFNEDGVVNGDDLAAWKAGFGKPGTPVPMEGDADGDQDVDGRDFLSWQRELGGAGSASITATAVPEPPAGNLVVLAAWFAVHGEHPRRRIRSRR